MTRTAPGEIGALDSLLLTRRPPLGPVTVVDVGGATPDQLLLATTLQGIVNRTEARIYLVNVSSGDGAGTSEGFWLQTYQQEGLVHVVRTTDLGGALEEFRGVPRGFIRASESEPWTIDVATTVAAATGSVVATDATIPALRALDLHETFDTVGRWSDAVSAYTWEVARLRTHMTYRGLAILDPATWPLRDFLVEQGILSLSTYPGDPGDPAIYALVQRFPPGYPVYGYIAQNPLQEVQAIARMSRDGRTVIASDTFMNLSFHVAVGDPTAPAHYRLPAVTTKAAPCSPNTVNVVVAITDGDALPADLNMDASTGYWSSPARGVLPIGWGTTPDLAVLTPAIWDYFVRTASPNDELVDMLGIGYTDFTVRPDPAAYIDESFAAMRQLGLHTFWSLDPFFLPDTAALTDVATAGPAHGVYGALDGYFNIGEPALFRSAGGFPVLGTVTWSYFEGPADFAAQVVKWQHEAPGVRPLVGFLAASVWQNPYSGLAAALVPLARSGVRFLTPSEAFACLRPVAGTPGP